jgi:hypothetical protein
MAGSTATQSILIVTNAPLDGRLVQALPGVDGARGDGTEMRVSSTRVVETVAHLMRLVDSCDLELIALHVQKATLEDVFIELTGAARRD